MAYNKDKNNFGKVTIGTNALGKSMIFKTDGPLDDRVALKTVASLISQKALGAKDDNGNYKSGANIKDWIYPAMTCAVLETGEVFVLLNKDQLELLSDNVIANLTDTLIEEKINKAWVKLAKNSDLQDIKNVVSGVFQFKGVATAIDPDHTTLTIGSGSIGITVGETTTNTPLVSYGTVFKDNFDDIMYAWGTAQTSNLFFTELPYTTKNAGLKLYKKYEKITSRFINVFDTLYIFGESVTANYDIPSLGEESPTTGTRTYEIWKDPDDGGGTLYSVSDNNTGTLNIYTVPPDSSTLPDALVTGIISTDFDYYTFTELTEPEKYDVTIFNSMMSITASSENNGHVYQIGEEEYASNGNIWVQLGSPKTDWIVL